MVFLSLLRDTNVGFEDGNFHHICLMWKSSNGEYQFYKDSKKVTRSMGLKTGYTIQPGGPLVLGQDQDKLAGDFNPDEAFVGELTELNVWDRGSSTGCYCSPTQQLSYRQRFCQLGMANGKFETLRDGETSVFLCETETF
ncbi:hypothetical protein OS493_017438 [Desmophyllum pertusum]|uniref:Pentraxin (PTX) domain-containing protein n=1 Tax=Desmophyllum pertusum TaxID=174260 RepID=A0A9W9ZQP3_9CNID|nr:hypothetical protein OS493_017438 [Desmophyllum pertusum]